MVTNVCDGTEDQVVFAQMSENETMHRVNFNLSMGAVYIYVMQGLIKRKAGEGVCFAGNCLRIKS